MAHAQQAKKTEPRTLLTLCIIQRRSRVLLGMKKRGFGAGRWNGFGGKVLPGETIEAAAKREIREEAGIDVKLAAKVGILEFEFKGKPGVLEVHVFKAEDFSGEPRETEEMRPQWFAETEIPFDGMWPDDRHWIPLFLADKKFAGKFKFGPGDRIIEQHLAQAD